MIIPISLSNKGNILLKKGQKVDFNTPLIKVEEEVQIQIPLAKSLGITPSKIFRYMKKFVGDQIHKGDMLAIKKNLFSQSTIISEHEGVLQEVNHIEGVISITTSNKTNNSLTAHFKGEIEEISDNKIMLKVSEGKKFELKKASHDFGGEVIYFKKNSALFLTEIEHKVLCGDSFQSYDLIKSEALSAKGVVAVVKFDEDVISIPYAQLTDESDIKKIFDLHFPYCLVDKKSSTIYFYK